MKPEKKPNPGTDKNSSKGGTNPPDTRGKPIKKRKLRELLMEILCRLLRLEEKHDLRFAWKISRATAKERNMPLDLTCTNEEKIEIFANPVTSTGKPTAIDGAISVSVVSGDGTTAAGSGPNAAFLVSGDNPGDTTYLVEADADLGAGVVTIQDTVTLHVQGAMATSLGLTSNPPQPK